MTVDHDTSIGLELPADTYCLRAIGPWSRGVLDLVADLDVDAMAPTLELALQEVCTNIVWHAYRSQSKGRIALVLTPFGADIRCEIRDTGVCFDPTGVDVPHPDRPQVGGYGLMLVERLTTDLRYRRQDNVNIWNLTFARQAQVAR